MKLSSVFTKLSTQFRTEFELLAGEINHRGLAGSARERALSVLLRHYLPRRAAVGTGVVIDALGAESKQVDLIIYDKESSSVFSIGGVDFFPCEGVIAAGEVKTQIDSRSDLETALENVESVKRLDRSNRRRNEIITGPGISLEPLKNSFDPNTNHRDQILTFLFTGGSLSRLRLIEELMRWIKVRPRKLWPNIYCDFNRFLISYKGQQLSPSPMEAESMYCTDDSEKLDLLLLFVCILADFVNSAHVARPNYFDYARIESTRIEEFRLPNSQDSGVSGR